MSIKKLYASKIDVRKRMNANDSAWECRRPEIN